MLFIKLALSAVALATLLRSLFKCSQLSYNLLHKLIRFTAQKQHSPVEELCHCGPCNN